MIRRCGAVPSPPDVRDRQFAALGGMCAVTPYTSSVPLGEIWDQGASSQCGGCAGSYYRREREYVQNKHEDRFSHTYIYGADNYSGDGMYGRTLAAILRAGVPHEQKWEHWGTKSQAQDIVSLYRSLLTDECKLYRADSYYFCTSWTEVLNAIRVCNGCILMVPCHDNWSAPANGVVGANRGSLWGYHFVFCKDYKQKDNGEYRIRFVNSWGPEWGDHGCGYLDTDVNRFEEAFAIVDNINEVKSKLRFDDVPDDAWFAKEIERAAELGLIKGTGENVFEPDAPITRAQAAVMMMRLYDKIMEGKS